MLRVPQSMAQDPLGCVGGCCCKLQAAARKGLDEVGSKSVAFTGCKIWKGSSGV